MNIFLYTKFIIIDMNLEFIFVCLIGLVIYTLGWTFYNDYGLFLFVLVLLFSSFLIYQFVENKILYWENYFPNVIKNQIQNLSNIKSRVLDEQLRNISNVKSNILSEFD